jgi:uncharacterized protein YbjQ (UPF0145 family)
MLISNIEQIPGKTIIEHYGFVSGSTVKAKHIGQDIMHDRIEKTLLAMNSKDIPNCLKKERIRP